MFLKRKVEGNEKEETTGKFKGKKEEN